MKNSDKVLVEAFYNQVAILHEGNVPREEIKSHIKEFANTNKLDLAEVLDILNDLIRKEKTDSFKDWYLE